MTTLSVPQQSNCCTKCNSCGSTNLSLDTTDLTVETTQTSRSKNLLERAHKYHQRILSSTLKNDHSHLSVKRRSRYDRLFHQTQMINRQYMVTMTNILFQMQKEIFKLKRRTNRIEQLALKQAKTVQPILRIPRLTQDQLVKICDKNDENVSNVSNENETIQDNNNNNIEITENIKPKSTKRNKQKIKKTRPPIWINNRQKPIDRNRYCSTCKHEFSKRSNFLIHVRNIHQGILPPLIDEQDQSLTEMNYDNTEKDLHQQTENSLPETINDQLVGVTNNDKQSSPCMINQCDIGKTRLRPRTSIQLQTESSIRAKIKCDICGKFYRVDYIKQHKRRAHPDQEVSSTLYEINNNLNRLDSTSDKPIDECHLSNENPSSIDEINTLNANTPTVVAIADIEHDDVPIRFGEKCDTNKRFVIAVTCLENYQIDLVQQFVEKFSSCVSSTTSIDSRTTHLITNDEKHSLRSPLSMKLIEAIAHHCFCVSYRWIIECLKYDRIVDEEPFEIEGDDTDVHPHGGPRRSRLITNRHSLFHEICFMIKCTENIDIRMTNERLEDLITTCGGQIITCVTQNLLQKYKIIVLCDMLYVSQRRHNYDHCRSLGIQFVSSDWVLESILEYRPKPFSLFEEVPL